MFSAFSRKTYRSISRAGRGIDSPMNLAHELNRRMALKGLSPRALSLKAGMDASGVRAILTGRSKSPRMATIQKLAAALDCTAADLIGGPALRRQLSESTPEAHSTEPGAKPATDGPDSLMSIAKTIPLLGAIEIDVGIFEMQREAPIDFIYRPPGIARDDLVYALYIEDDSLIPARMPGELIYVHMRRPPSIGSDAVIHLGPRNEEGYPSRFLIKRIAGSRDEKLELEQFNPPKKFEIQRSTILHLHRILTLAELMGV